MLVDFSFECFGVFVFVAVVVLVFVDCRYERWGRNEKEREIEPKREKEKKKRKLKSEFHIDIGHGKGARITCCRFPFDFLFTLPKFCVENLINMAEPRCVTHWVKARGRKEAHQQWRRNRRKTMKKTPSTHKHTRTHGAIASHKLLAMYRSHCESVHILMMDEWMHGKYLSLVRKKYRFSSSAREIKKIKKKREVSDPNGRRRKING